MPSYLYHVETLTAVLQRTEVLYVVQLSTGRVETRVQVDLEVAKVDVSYIDSFVKSHGFVAW